MGSAHEKDALVAAVGRECERAAQLDWAVELYLYAGQPRAALALINQQLSNALEPALKDSGKGTRASHRRQLPQELHAPRSCSQKHEVRRCAAEVHVT